MVLVEYETHNYAGDWWLKDEDWLNLQRAGWEIGLRGLYNKKKEIPEKLDDYGFIDTYKAFDGKTRWLGAIATNAKKEFNSVEEALREFEQITKATITDEGCNYCGSPHSFNWTNEKGEYNYCYGEECLKYLYPDKNIPSSLREAVEQSITKEVSK